MIGKSFRCKKEYVDFDIGVIFEENEVYIVIDYCEGFLWFFNRGQIDYMFELDAEFYEHFEEVE